MAAALNRFISRSADMCRPFYQLLHKWKDFRWTEECALAFEDLKQYLSNPPILSRPEKEEVLYAYLAVTDYAVSLVLVRNADGIQMPVYYAVLAIVHAMRKLLHYFQAHLVVVLTQLPLQALLRESDYTGQVAKWGIRLGAYDVKYMPWTATKGQVLADFVAEFIEENLRKEEAILTVMFALPTSAPLWEVYTDGASNGIGVGVGMVLITPERLIMEKSLRLGFTATNNEAEYEAFLAGALMVSQLREEVVKLYCDSCLVIGQVNGEFEARDERMQKYLTRVKCDLNKFKSFVVKQIPRGQNAHANSLAMLATSLGSKLPRGILPEDKTEAVKVCRNAPRYWLSEEQKLYKRSYLGLYLLCVHPEAVEHTLEELHEGICGSHTRGRSLAHQALTQGY
ncbi:uncharacterized protein LOC142644302 [Castanea sativa]|uniref:uncharacterized protein LOC142644302 n=1 Tax=Castanea sativa TaxID=21020 RepID=UPI003F64F992